MLNQLRLDYQLRRGYTQVIEAYLDYCRLNGLSVQVDTARGFMEDALRRGLTGDAAQWKEGLNWFFRAGRERSAPQPGGRAQPGAGRYWNYPVGAAPH